jgi:NHL repeat.
MDVAVDAAGAIYIVDTDNDRVVKYPSGASSGTVVAGQGGQGNQNDELDGPTSVAVDASGAVYVADSANDRVVKYDSGATSGSVVAGGNGPGSALDELNNPTGVAVDETGAIHVSDSGNNRVIKVPDGATDGEVVSSHGQLNAPRGLALNSDGTLHVADTGNHRVMEYDDVVDSLPSDGGTGGAGGTLGGTDTASGDGLDEFDNPVDVHVAADGTKYVLDRDNNRVLKFPPGAIEGEVVAGGNGAGTGLEQLFRPKGSL